MGLVSECSCIQIKMEAVSCLKNEKNVLVMLVFGRCLHVQWSDLLTTKPGVFLFVSCADLLSKSDAVSAPPFAGSVASPFQTR